MCKFTIVSKTSRVIVIKFLDNYQDDIKKHDRISHKSPVVSERIQGDSLVVYKIIPLEQPPGFRPVP